MVLKQAYNKKHKTVIMHSNGRYCGVGKARDYYLGDFKKELKEQFLIMIYQISQHKPLYLKNKSYVYSSFKFNDISQNNNSDLEYTKPLWEISYWPISFFGLK